MHLFETFETKVSGELTTKHHISPLKFLMSPLILEKFNPYVLQKVE